MRIASLSFLILLYFSASSLRAETNSSQPGAQQAGGITIQTNLLGDSEAGVVTRITFQLKIDDALPGEAPLVVQGSILHQGIVL